MTDLDHGQRSRALRQRLAMVLLSAAAMFAGAAWADPPGRVGRVAEMQGTVWIYDTEQGEWIAVRRNRPVTAGDRFSAERDARLEVQIGSSTLRLDGGSEIEVVDLDDDQVRIQLHGGHLALRIRDQDAANDFSVSTAEGRFSPQRVGQYRVDRLDDGSFAEVTTGSLRFDARDSTLVVAAGQRAEFWSERGVTHYSWAAPARDGFADWVARQDREDDRLGRQRYVSPEMTGADDLDRYGDWDRHAEYGAVWLPRRVAPGWAPYRYGHWSYVRPWGWTWVDDAPWGFAPFHYGRWVWWRDRWAWAPGQYVARPVYAPALVAWIGGSNFSVGINIGGGPAVGWVPLSPREVYVPTYHVTHVYVSNVNSPYRRWQPPLRPNQPVRTGPIMYTNQGVPGGVTVVSQQVLRERRPISNAVIAPVDGRAIGRWQSEHRSDGRRVSDAVAYSPPAPSPRVLSVPGGAVPVPTAPGGLRAGTPWGSAEPRQPRGATPPSPAPRDGERSRHGRAAPAAAIDQAPPAVIERSGGAPSAQGREDRGRSPSPRAQERGQERSQERGPGRAQERGQDRDHERSQGAGPDTSRIAAPAAPTPMAVPMAVPVPVAPAAQPQPAAAAVLPAPGGAARIHGIRPPTPTPAQAQTPAAPPPVAEPRAERRNGNEGRGQRPQEADEREDGRQPPGQERRREQRRERNQ